MLKTTVGRENGMLSDIQILERLVADDPLCIFVSPLINPLEQLGPASLDLRLGTELSVTRTLAKTHINLKEGVAMDKHYYDLRQGSTDSAYVLHPGEFALASTLEFIRLPSDIAGRLEGRSTYGRLGLQVHATAGFVDPGFEGTLTFELINSGKLPIELFPGVRLGQICFLKTESVQVSYMDKKTSKYGGKLGIEHAQLHLEVEINDKASSQVGHTKL